MTPRRSAMLAALAAVLVLAGCGGSIPAKASGEEPLPPTADSTLAALDRAEADLRLALGEPPADRSLQPGYPPAAMSSAAPVAPGMTSPPPPPSAPESVSGGAAQKPSSADAPAPGAESTSAPDPCVNACRALASMSRATEHLCNLAGSGDARCESARTRVKSAGERVRAHCPSCAAG